VDFPPSINILDLHVEDADHGGVAVFDIDMVDMEFLLGGYGKGKEYSKQYKRYSLQVIQHMGDLGIGKIENFFVGWNRSYTFFRREVKELKEDGNTESTKNHGEHENSNRHCSSFREQFKLRELPFVIFVVLCGLRVTAFF